MEVQWCHLGCRPERHRDPGGVRRRQSERANPADPLMRAHGFAAQERLICAPAHGAPRGAVLMDPVNLWEGRIFTDTGKDDE
jgi:hypothetical protein